jgi:hypothetical protein
MEKSQSLALEEVLEDMLWGGVGRGGGWQQQGGSRAVEDAHVGRGPGSGPWAPGPARAPGLELSEYKAN